MRVRNPILSSIDVLPTGGLIMSSMLTFANPKARNQTFGLFTTEKKVRSLIFRCLFQNRTMCIQILICSSHWYLCRWESFVGEGTIAIYYEE